MIDLTRQPRYDPDVERRFVAEGYWTDDVLGDWLSDRAERNGADPAIVAGGRLITGAGGNAGEIGHMKVAGVVAECGCGEIGCIRAAFARAER